MVTVAMEPGDGTRPFLEMDDATWDRDLAMNLGTAYNVTRAVLPGMVERRWGRVVMVSSVTGPWSPTRASARTQQPRPGWTA